MLDYIFDKGVSKKKNQRNCLFLKVCCLSEFVLKDGYIYLEKLFFFLDGFDNL